jgi:hypothetical protein
MQIRAIDAAGNIDGSPANYPWTVQPGGTPVDCGPAQTLSADADAWIDSGSTSTNKGTDSVLKVMSKSGNNLRALVHFDLPTMPAGCQLDTAELRLYAGSSSSSQRTLEALRLDGPWTEGAVTWANAPLTSGLAVTTISGNGYREWDVVTLVQAMYSTGQENGFLIKDATENQDAEQQLFAREKGENPPQLVITFKPVSAGSVPGGPATGASCAQSCSSPTAAAWALAPVTVETAGLLGTVLALTLGAAAFGALAGRRVTSAPPVAGASFGWRQAIPR